MNNPTALDYWTLAIALVGATTGVAALATEVWGLVLAGPRVNVSIANSLILTGDGRWSISIDVSNVGRLPVTILELGLTFRIDDERKNIPIGLMGAGSWHGDSLPFRLIDGEAQTWLLDPAPIADLLLKNGSNGDVRGYARLATGKARLSRRTLNAVTVSRLHQHQDDA